MNNTHTTEKPSISRGNIPAHRPHDQWPAVETKEAHVTASYNTILHYTDRVTDFRLAYHFAESVCTE